MRASLPEEIAAFLRASGPARAKEIAAAVRARRADVDAVLAGAGFAVAARPVGAYSRSRYFDVSRRVPRSDARGSRADLMLRALADGRPHTREEILQAAGRPFLTNNAAHELRKRGLDVRRDGRAYQLVGGAG